MQNANHDKGAIIGAVINPMLSLPKRPDEFVQPIIRPAKLGILAKPVNPITKLCDIESAGRRSMLSNAVLDDVQYVLTRTRPQGELKQRV